MEADLKAVEQRLETIERALLGTLDPRAGGFIAAQEMMAEEIYADKIGLRPRLDSLEDKILKLKERNIYQAGWMAGASAVGAGLFWLAEKIFG